MEHLPDPKPGFSKREYVLLALSVTLIMGCCTFAGAIIASDGFWATFKPELKVDVAGINVTSTPETVPVPRSTELSEGIELQPVADSLEEMQDECLNGDQSVCDDLWAEQIENWCPDNALIHEDPYSYGNVICDGELPADGISGPAIIEAWPASQGSTAYVFGLNQGYTFDWNERGHYWIFWHPYYLESRYSGHVSDFLAKTSNHIEGLPYPGIPGAFTQ